MPTEKTFPALERLRAYAGGLRSGVSGAELADFSGVRAQLLSEARSGRRNLTAEEAEKIAKAEDVLGSPLFPGVSVRQVLEAFNARAEAFQTAELAKASPAGEPGDAETD